MKRIVLSLLLLFWACCIFFFSSQTGTKSKKLTVHSIDKIVSVVQDSENIEKKFLMEKVITPIRKSAHFVEFFILGIVTCLLLREFLVTNKTLFLSSSLFCILYACIDEFHQFFVPGRVFKVLDIIIDSCGSLFGIGLIAFIYNRHRKVKSNH